jgi:hypothetical protein
MTSSLTTAAASPAIAAPESTLHHQPSRRPQTVVSARCLMLDSWTLAQLSLFPNHGVGNLVLPSSLAAESGVTAYSRFWRRYIMSIARLRRSSRTQRQDLLKTRSAIKCMFLLLILSIMYLCFFICPRLQLCPWAVALRLIVSKEETKGRPGASLTRRLRG